MRRVLSICLLLVTLFHAVGIHGSATAVPMLAFGRAKGKLSTATATFTPVLTATTRVITYSYDGLQRLTGAVESPGSSFAYAYDLASNRTGVTVNGTQTIRPAT